MTATLPTIEIGSKKTFCYPNYGTPDGYPEHTAHSGQHVTVLRKLGPEEAGHDMYEVKALDGWKGHVCADELSPPRWTKKTLQAEVATLDDEIEIYWDRDDELSKDQIEKIIEQGLEGLDEVQMELTDHNDEYLWEQKESAITEHLERMSKTVPVSDKAEKKFRQMVYDSDKLLESCDLKGLARNSGEGRFVVIVKKPAISFQAWRGVESKGQVDELCALCDLLQINPARLQEFVTCDNDNRPSYDPDPAIFPILPSRHGHEYVSIEGLMATLHETSYGGQLVFMLRMPLGDLLDNPEGYTKGPLRIKKGTLGLIYEYCNGAGSCPDMELLKDLVLPTGSYDFELDASRRWGLDACYGFTEVPWKAGNAEPVTPDEDA